LYEMLAGARPYEAPTEASLITAILTEEMVPLRARTPDVPPALDRIILRALHRRAEDRYPDCRAMHADLEAAIRASPQPATVFQIAQLAATDDVTGRESLPRALATPDRPYRTVRTPSPWRADGTDAKGRAVQLAEPLALTGTEHTYKRPAPPPDPVSGPLALLAPAEGHPAQAGRADGEGPTLRRTPSSTAKTISFATSSTAKTEIPSAPFMPGPGRGDSHRRGQTRTEVPWLGWRSRRLAVPVALASAAVLAALAGAAVAVVRAIPPSPPARGTAPIQAA